MIFTAGSRVRFTAVFRLATGKVFDPGAVSARVGDDSQPVTRREVGVYSIDHVVRDDPTVVVFESTSGEFSETAYRVTSQKLSETRRVLPAPAGFDRADARRQLLAAGVSFDESWSDAKVRGALSGLEYGNRQRKAWGF